MYEIAVVPPEVPEKNDHGDIDFLVAGPLINCNLSCWQTASGLKEKGKVEAVLLLSPSSWKKITTPTYNWIFILAVLPL